MACCAAGFRGREGDMCDYYRTWEEELYWKRFKHLHFCQILGEDAEFHKQLLIPRKFADSARANLPPKVTLRGPSGASWYAIITTTGNDLFLSDGWEEFADAYSLQTNDILIFKYDGVSIFDVLIFHGENLCERESAYFVKKCGHEDTPFDRKRKRLSREVDAEENGDARIEEATKRAREEVGKKAADESRRKLRNTKSGSRSNAMREKPVQRKAASSKASPAKKAPPTSSRNSCKSFAELGKPVVQNATSILEPENATGIHHRRNALRSNGSTPAEAPDQYTAPSNGNWVADPPSQDTQQINGSFPTDASPLSAKKVSGETKATRNVASTRGRRETGVGARGRKKASVSNVGTQSENSTKKVASVDGLAIGMGAAEGADDIPFGSPDSLSRLYVSGGGKMALERARKEMTESSFVVVMRPTSVYRRFLVTVPPAFHKMHLAPKSQDVFLRIGDKTWLTRLTYSAIKATGQICGGWKQFVQENQLEQFDVCLFSLVSQNEDSVMLDVGIFRAGPAEPVPLGQVMADPSVQTVNGFQ